MHPPSARPILMTSIALRRRIPLISASAPAARFGRNGSRCSRMVSYAVRDLLPRGLLRLRTAAHIASRLPAVARPRPRAVGAAARWPVPHQRHPGERPMSRPHALCSPSIEDRHGAHAAALSGAGGRPHYNPATRSTRIVKRCSATTLRHVRRHLRLPVAVQRPGALRLIERALPPRHLRIAQSRLQKARAPLQARRPTTA